MRLPLAIAAVIVLALPALAETAARGSGRYAVEPSDDGFVRLDTESGSASHCRRVDGVWRCEAIADEPTAIERKLDSLSAAVGALTEEVGRLKAEIAELKSDTSSAQRTPGATSEDQKELERTLGFAEQLMRRFFRMVREMRGEDRPSI
jgi:hypothetical protein